MVDWWLSQSYARAFVLDVPFHRKEVCLELSRVLSLLLTTTEAGQEDQDERAQADQAQGKIFTPGDFGPPRIAEKPTQVRFQRATGTTRIHECIVAGVVQGT